MRWKLEIKGNHVILYQFLNFMSSPHFAIYNDSDDYEADQYFLVSRHFDNVESKEQVFSMASGLIKLINGALAIEYGFLEYRKRGSLEIKGVYSSDIDNPTDSQWKHQFFPNNVVPSNPFINEAISYNLSYPYKYLTTAYIEMCLEHEDVFNLLLQISAASDWVGLYSILDTVTYYGSGLKKVISDLGLDNSAINAFTGTSNSYGILGIQARHGIKGWEIPNNTVTLDEAMSIINDVVVKYLAKNYCLVCKQKEWSERIVG